MKFNLVKEISKCYITNALRAYWSIVILGTSKHSDFYKFHGFYYTCNDTVKAFIKIINEPISKNFDDSLVFFDESKQEIICEFSSAQELKEFINNNPEIML